MRTKLGIHYTHDRFIIKVSSLHGSGPHKSRALVVVVVDYCFSAQSDHPHASGAIVFSGKHNFENHRNSYIGIHCTIVHMNFKPTFRADFFPVFLVKNCISTGMTTVQPPHIFMLYMNLTSIISFIR